MATAYLVRWNGHLRESDDKYPRPGQSVKMSPVRHTQRVYVFLEFYGCTDNATIKQAVMDYGAVIYRYALKKRLPKESTGGYYYNGSAA